MEENPKLYTTSTNTADMFISSHISINPPKGCLLKLERTSHKAQIVLIMKQRTLGVWSEGDWGRYHLLSTHTWIQSPLQSGH